MVEYTALSDSYPVSGRWGISDSTQEGAINCTGKRVITFKGDQRFDSGVLDLQGGHTLKLQRCK